MYYTCSYNTYNNFTTTELPGDSDNDAPPPCDSMGGPDHGIEDSDPGNPNDNHDGMTDDDHRTRADEDDTAGGMSDFGGSGDSSEDDDSTSDSDVMFASSLSSDAYSSLSDLSPNSMFTLLYTPFSLLSLSLSNYCTLGLLSACSYKSER